jgi:hypothetical protein
MIIIIQNTLVWKCYSENADFDGFQYDVGVAAWCLCMAWGIGTTTVWCWRRLLKFMPSADVNLVISSNLQARCCFRLQPKSITSNGQIANCVSCDQRRDLTASWKLLQPEFIQRIRPIDNFLTRWCIWMSDVSEVARQLKPAISFTV